MILHALRTNVSAPPAMDHKNSSLTSHCQSICVGNMANFGVSFKLPLIFKQNNTFQGVKYSEIRQVTQAGISETKTC